VRKDIDAVADEGAEAERLAVLVDALLRCLRPDAEVDVEVGPERRVLRGRLTEIVFGEGRRALAFGEQKLNLHRAGHEYEPKAEKPTPGSADLCFLTDADAATIDAWLRARGVAVEEGPVSRTGALGPIVSFYFRDPDGNLVELATLPGEDRRAPIDAAIPTR
jgi:catechol 2,3-dioxygenase-like lactoylglutathione lyase family enzyme